MDATTKAATGPAVREAPKRLAPDQLAPAQEVLDRWWVHATGMTHPLNEQEQEQLARARNGNFAGFLVREGEAWQQL